MHKILVLWAVPRSTSTAFEWMMRMRGDMTCFHEPFGEAWYQGEDPMWPRVQPDSIRTPGLTIDSVWDMLKSTACQGPVFSKDFPHYVKHMFSREFLDHFNHSFLIRNPAKTIASMYRHWPDFHPDETGFAEQRQLFDILSAESGKSPPVIDSDDLLADPATMVEVWCNAVGIPFIPEALSWKPGPRDEVSWWDGGSFHANLRNSDGLKPQKPTDIDISTLPDRVKGILEVVRPHYEHLHAHRMTAPGKTSGSPSMS